MSKVFAKVAIDSPLPQLDRLFDYEIPDHLVDSAQVGVRVRVPFGKGASLHDGFLIETASSSEFAAAEIAEVVSPVSVLSKEHYAFLRAIADRQAGTLSELFKLAIPKRSVRVEKSWINRTTVPESHFDYSLEFAGKPTSFHGKNALLAEPRLLKCSFIGGSVAENKSLVLQGWIANFVSAALNQLSQNRSCIIVVPDFRDQHRLMAAFQDLGLAGCVIDYGSDQLGSERYSSYLLCLEGRPRVVIGSRSAIYAPVSNLGAVLLWDDIDQSLHEPMAPYIHAREVALVRQQMSHCDLLIAAHSRSVEVQRLVEIGYLIDLSPKFAAPKIAVTEPGLRVDSTSYQAVKQALEAGGAALVQVAATGHSVSTYCVECNARSKCSVCHGPLFIDDKGTARCRWCSALNLNTRCLECNSSKIRQGGAGATRTAAELGKSFPGVKVIEATNSKRILELPAGKCLVVATPGAEPYISGGYEAVVILDGQKLLARDTLRAAEQAVNLWSNAVSLLSPTGRAVGVGLASPLGQRFALWDQIGIATQELRQRRELNFPPHHRLASITGPRQLVDEIVLDLAKAVCQPNQGSLEVLGPLSLASEARDRSYSPELTQEVWRYLIRYDYSMGEALATELKARTLKANAGSKSLNQKTGRASRAVRVKMDDSEVI